MKHWPTFPLTIGSYTVENVKEVKEKVEELKEFHFGLLKYETYDLEKVVESH